MTRGPDASDGSLTDATPFRLRFVRARLTRTLWSIVAALIVIHLSLQMLRHWVTVPWDLHLVFNVDDEPTVPTWYSSASLLFASGLLWLIADARTRERAPGARHWRGLAAGFAFLSLDEIAAFHEMFNTFMSVEWTIPAAVIALVVGATYVPFVRRLPARHRNRFVIAGAVFLAGALVVEYLTGPQYFPYDIDSVPYAWMTALEEGLEMSGVVLFIDALLRYMEEETSPSAVPVRVEIGRRA